MSATLRVGTDALFRVRLILKYEYKLCIFVVFCRTHRLFQSVIVNVEYRHYPEADLLDPFDDGVWVTQWVQSNVQLIGE